MNGTGYTLQSKPGALLEASRNPKMKRAVMKAIGMPMKPKKRKAIKMSGKFEGKSNMLGQGGRAAQLKARGVPGGVIGNLARAAHAAPGQKNFHKKKIAKKDGEPNDIGNEAAKKAKKRKSAHSYKNLGKFAHKKAKMTIANSEGDEGPLKKSSKKKSK